MSAHYAVGLGLVSDTVYAECSISCEFLQRIRIRDVSEHGAGIPGGLQGWQKPSDFPQVAPNKIVWLKSATDVGNVVMGNGHGYLTASCNLKDICLKLAQTASEHHANAIATQTVKGEVIVQFLRVKEHVFIQKTNGVAAVLRRLAAAFLSASDLFTLPPIRRTNATNRRIPFRTANPSSQGCSGRTR